VQPPTGLCNLTHPAPRERPMIMKDLVLPAVPDPSWSSKSCTDRRSSWHGRVVGWAAETPGAGSLRPGVR